MEWANDKAGWITAVGEGKQRWPTHNRPAIISDWFRIFRLKAINKLTRYLHSVENNCMKKNDNVFLFFVFLCEKAKRAGRLPSSLSLNRIFGYFMERCSAVNNNISLVSKMKILLVFWIVLRCFVKRSVERKEIHLWAIRETKRGVWS